MPGALMRPRRATATGAPTSSRSKIIATLWIRSGSPPLRTRGRRDHPEPRRVGLLLATARALMGWTSRARAAGRPARSGGAAPASSGAHEHDADGNRRVGNGGEGDQPGVVVLRVVRQP